MKNFLLGFALLVSVPCFAMTEEDEVSAPMHYAIVPSVGIHLGFSELAGTNSVSTGIMGGIGFRFLRDGYFFTPAAHLIGLAGLDKSPLTMWSVGFTAGGHLNSPSIDIFAGVDVTTIIAYKTGSSAFVKLGTDFDLGLSDFQLVLDVFYGNFSHETPTKLINYPYVGAEMGVQFPIEL